MTTPTRPLGKVGVEVLLVYGAEIYPPRGGRPGISVTVDRRGVVMLEAVGYLDKQDRRDAINAAAIACIESGLLVEPGRHRYAVTVRRRPS